MLCKPNNLLEGCDFKSVSKLNSVIILTESKIELLVIYNKKPYICETWFKNCNVNDC